MTLALIAMSLAGAPATPPATSAATPPATSAATPPATSAATPANGPADAPLTTREDAVRTIREHTGRPEELRLSLSDALLDPVGMNMAIITDAALGRGWMPNGFEQGDGFRTYLYKALK
jgi:hypothetical protein